MIAALCRFGARLRDTFRGRALEADFSDELAHHVEELTRENLRGGLRPAEARRQAVLAVGGIEQTRALHRQARGLPALEALGQDLSFGWRRCGRDRSFTLVFVLILMLGVGLNTTVFSLLDTVVLRPLPLAEAGRLVWIANGDSSHASRDWSAYTSRIDTWEGLAQRTHALDRIEAYFPFSSLFSGKLALHDDFVGVTGFGVSAGLFDLLGLEPLRGRFFVADDGRANAPVRIVLSYPFWQARFGGDAAVVGRILTIDGKPVEVAGIMPEYDRFAEVFCPGARIDYYWAIKKEAMRDWGNTVALIGRMKPGVGPGPAQADLNGAIEQIKQEKGRAKDLAATLTPLKAFVIADLQRPLLFLWIAAGVALAIVAINLGGLLLARGAARQGEFALRASLGASRGRLAALVVTECVLLILPACLLGLGLAVGLVHLLTAQSGVVIPLLHGIRVDSAALLFTAILCAAIAFLCGLFPAWQIARSVDLQSRIQSQGNRSSAGAGQARLRRTLVVIEVALACVLVVAGGLMAHSFVRLLQVDLGFEPERVLAVRIDTTVPFERIGPYLQPLLDRVRAAPGVEAAGLTDCIPVEKDRSWAAYPVNAADPKDRRWQGGHVRVVTPGLLAAMGTRLLAGRDFGEADGREPVVILNRTMARRFWPGQEAVGRFIRINTPYQVIGVVEDVRHAGPAVSPGNEMYFSLRQVGTLGTLDLIVRSRSTPGAIVGAVRAALHEIDPTLPFTAVRPLSTLIDRTVSARRFLVGVFGVFAGLALLLAAIGLYGVISYMVAQRTKEIGIRMALGATAAAVRNEVIASTMKLAMAGLGLGLTASVGAGFLMRSLLFGTAPLDPATYAAAIAILLGSAYAAGYIPARAAATVDPMVALRCD